MKLAITAALALLLCACAAPRNDGMGDLWKAVKHCNEGHC